MFYIYQYIYLKDIYKIFIQYLSYENFHTTQFRIFSFVFYLYYCDIDVSQLLIIFYLLFLNKKPIRRLPNRLNFLFIFFIYILSVEPKPFPALSEIESYNFVLSVISSH